MASLQLGNTNAMAFSPDGSLLALGGDDGALLLLEWPAVKQRFSLA